jgi:CP family cyanate transporter-like MFS transporter
LVGRLGAFKVVGIGLAVAAAGELARALPGGVPILFLSTAVMGAGIAATQPGLPVALQSWFGAQVQLASVALALGITVGEVVAAGTTSSLVLVWLGSWQVTMTFWGVLGVTCVPVWLFGVPRDRAGIAGATHWELRRLLLSWRLWAI